MQKENFQEYALILRKFELLRGIFIYRPERVEIGHVDNNYFYLEKSNQSYGYIGDDYFNYSNEDEGYYIIETTDKVVEDFINSGMDDISFLEEKYSNSLFIGYFNNVINEFTINEISIDDLFTEKYEVAVNVDENADPKVECCMPIDNIIQILEENDYNKEKVSAIMNTIKDSQEEIESFIFSDTNFIEVKKEEEKVDYEEMKKIVNSEPVEISPRDQARILYKELKDRIIGQDEAIKTICYVLYKNSILDDNQKKTNCLLVGPTGSGKSEIINIVSEVYHKPLVHVDSNSNTAAGYVGDSLTDNLASLMVKANGDKYIAEHGIVAFDEIDKRGDGDRGNVNGKMVLDGILRFAEGQEYNVEYKLNGAKHSVLFDTSNLTIFASGAFPEVFNEKIKKLSTSKSSVIGFNVSNATEKEKQKEKQKLEENIELTHEDIATIGRMGPEFVGRFIVTTLHKLNVDDLKRIMTESTISPLTEEIEILKKDNIEFTGDDKFITTLAKRAYKEGSGGRGIRNNIEKLFQNIYVKTVFEEDNDLEDKDGIIKIKGTADEEGNIIIKPSNSEKVLHISKKDQSSKTLKKVRD